MSHSIYSVRPSPWLVKAEPTISTLENLQQELRKPRVANTLVEDPSPARVLIRSPLQPWHRRKPAGGRLVVVTNTMCMARYLEWQAHIRLRVASSVEVP